MKSTELSLPSDKSFGVLFTSVFCLLAIYCFYIDQIIAGAISTFVALVFVIALSIKPILLRPLNMLWMRFGLFLSLIISPIVLGIIYFGLITPVAVCTRLFGRDELLLKKSSKKSSWQRKTELNELSNAFKNQF